MRADLNRPVAGVGHDQRARSRPTLISIVAGQGFDFTGYQLI
jgi:hypothetical protein